MGGAPHHSGSRTGSARRIEELSWPAANLATPRQLYADRVRRGVLQFDPFQGHVIDQLDRLYLRIQEPGSDEAARARDATGGGPLNLFKRLFKRSSGKGERGKRLVPFAAGIYGFHAALKSNSLRSVTLLEFFVPLTHPGERPVASRTFRFGKALQFRAKDFGLGTGKTMLMDLFYTALPADFPKRRVHFHAFMIEVHDRVGCSLFDRYEPTVTLYALDGDGVGIHRLKKETPNLADPIVPLAADIAKDARVLCFDELQVTDIADAMILRRLFAELFGHGISILTTSNRPPDELYRNGLQRQSFIPCINLLKAECQIVDLNSGVDYRTLGECSIGSVAQPVPEALMARYILLPHVDGLILMGYVAKNSNRLYFSPHDGRTQTIMDELFKRAIGHATPSSETLTFLGRKLVVPEAFEGPLNASDYLKLAERYHTVFLEGVLKLGKLDRNVVRRFITLLDALYENKNTLVCSAECELPRLFSDNSHLEPNPQEADRLLLDDLGLGAAQLSASLFTGEEEKFALARAFSRLSEMQSLSWVGHNPRAPRIL
ncbi:ATPase [Massospora cicadina]|nr:ATPase [Massospora cicadina]